MSRITLAPNASGTGTLTIAAPNTNTDRTLTLPDDTGTLIYSNASGNVGVGTSSPSARLDVSGAISVSGDGSDVAIYMNGSDAIRNTSTGGIVYHDVAFGSASHGQFVFRSSNAATERMRIDASGNVLVGKTTTLGDVTNVGVFMSTTGKSVFTTTGSIQPIVVAKNASTSGSFIDFFYNGAGIGSITTNGTSITFNTYSDYRLKENVQPMVGALDKIAQLNPVTYNWKSDGSDGQGFIAHELQAVVPDCVSGEKDAVDDEGNPKHQGIDTSFLVATLVKAIQEQQAIITALEARIAALEAK